MTYALTTKHRFIFLILLLVYTPQRKTSVQCPLSWSGGLSVPVPRRLKEFSNRESMVNAYLAGGGSGMNSMYGLAFAGLERRDEEEICAR